MKVDPPKPPDNPNAWEDEFFASEGVTDDDEKAVIRGRARVLAYDRARQKAAGAKDNPPKKRWFDQ